MMDAISVLITSLSYYNQCLIDERARNFKVWWDVRIKKALIRTFWAVAYDVFLMVKLMLF